MSSEAYILEIFASLQGEGGTVRGSCFGKRQIFIRFAGCNLAKQAFGTDGCIWCDSSEAQLFKPKRLSYEMISGTQAMKFTNNPINFEKLIKIVKKLITPDLHSISITGGEPLCQIDTILNLAKLFRESSIDSPLYLETNGTIIPNEIQREGIKKHFKYCCCDIKDRSSNAATKDQWENLVKTELKFIKCMIESGLEIFAKIVITAHTDLQDIRWISKELSEIKYSNGNMAGLAIQPVNIERKELMEKLPISNKFLNEVFYAAAEFLSPESLTLSIQAHKYLKLL